MPEPPSPRVAIIGGTGRLGGALAQRLHAAGVEVLLGSRDAAKARASAESRGLSVQAGRRNREAADAADVIIVTVPYEAHREILREIADGTAGKIVVETTVPLAPYQPASSTGGRRAVSTPGGTGLASKGLGPLPAGSAAEAARTLLATARVVAGFHTVSAPMLADLSKPPHGDVLLCGDDPAAKDTVAALVRRIGMRAVDAGPLEHARVLEQLAGLLLTLNKRHKRRDLGIQIVGLE